MSTKPAQKGSFQDSLSTYVAATAAEKNDALETLDERPTPSVQPRLRNVAKLSLSIGRLFMEFGESARVIHKEILKTALALGCDSAEAYCQHSAIIVTLRRDEHVCVQMGKVGEHGVNLRRS